MKYRYLADSIDGVLQLLAASYLRHGYYWYVTGHLPPGRSALDVDRKLIGKYGIDISERDRSRRKKQGLANAHYVRFEDWFCSSPRGTTRSGDRVRKVARGTT